MLGQFGSKCRRFRGVARWFEAGEAVLVTVVTTVNNVGNGDAAVGDGELLSGSVWEELDAVVSECQGYANPRG